MPQRSRESITRVWTRLVVIFGVGDERPTRSTVSPKQCDRAQQVRLDQLVTPGDSRPGSTVGGGLTFYGDLFAHVVSWQGDLYLEDGLHRALRAALQQRQTIHARVLELS